MSTALGQVQLDAQGAMESLSDQTQGGQLEFAPIGTVLDNSSSEAGMYEATIQLASYSGDPLKEFQFALVTKGKTIIGPISKTGAFLTSDWVLNTNVVSRTAQTDGSSIDTVNVLLYGNGSTSLAPISVATPVLTFRYNVINISLETETAEMCLISISGGTSTILDAKLNASACETINIQNRSFWGDVNGDDHVDIFDLLAVVDHIAGKDTLVGGEITCANVGDWSPASSAPSQEVPVTINALDLVVLQNIILNGEYPDGTPLILLKTAPLAVETGNGISKETVVVDATVIFHVHNLGITIRLVNTVPLKGLQADLVGITSIPANIISPLSNSCMGWKNNILRVLAYDLQGTVVGPGDHIIAEIPINISDPFGVSEQNLLAAGEANQKINVVVNYSHSPVDVAPLTEEMHPVHFELGQNYPNPFNPNTNITFSVPGPSDVRIMIYNMLGQEVRVLFAGQLNSGTQTLPFDGKDQSGRVLASGIYIYRMVAGSFVESKKMQLIK
jgi:hypothetical protein